MADKDRDQLDQDTRGDEKEQQQGEKDDVAEDRNLSGSSTWLNLPDKQPRGDADSNDDDGSDRQSKR